MVQNSSLFLLVYVHGNYNYIHHHYRCIFITISSQNQCKNKLVDCISILIKGINFNDDKWQSWLISLFVSMLVNLLISQPLQVELILLIFRNQFFSKFFIRNDLGEPKIVFREITVSKHFPII